MLRETLTKAAAAAAIFGATAFAAVGASAQLLPNQTAGFAKGKNYTFTYTEQYDCVEEPTDDLNYDGNMAQTDPIELQTPICQAGANPTVDPTGAKIKTTDKLYVLVPMFSVNLDTNAADAIACPTTLPSFAPNSLNGPVTPVNEVCGTALGNFLITTFGSIPDAFRNASALAADGITTQCPNPTDPSGSCTMHAHVLDISAALGSAFKNLNTMVPLVNHSHIIDTSINSKKSIWWQVIVDLVNDPAVWPSADGTKGLTSLKALRAAQNTPTTVSGGTGNQVSADTPTNFFLFFGSQKNKSGATTMAGMPGM